MTAPLGGQICDEVQTWPAVPAWTEERVQHIRKTWTATARVLSLEWSSTGIFTGQPDLAWRYGDAGRIMAYVGYSRSVPPDSGNFQHDHRYDDHGNHVDFRLSYPDRPDLMMPSEADPWMGFSYENVYDGLRLVTSTETPYGPGTQSLRASRQTFSEDATGRCERVESVYADEGDSQFVETRAYDTAGRLVTIQSVRPPSSVRCGSQFTIKTYDTEGRIKDTSTWCGPDDTGSIGWRTIVEYAADGSQTEERFDFVTDVAGDGHSFVTRSPACAAINQSIGVPAGLECRVP